MKEIPRPTSKFLKVTCGRCKNEQVIFSKASRDVHCLVCNSILAESGGGKARIKTRVLQAFD